MFRKNTLLILGAGASADLNFPLGRKFKLDIADLTSFVRLENDSYSYSESASDDEFNFLVREYVAAKNRLGDHPPIDTASIHRAMKMVSQGVGFAPSIDVFLKMRSGERSVELLSKAAIATLILRHEKEVRQNLAPSDNYDWRPQLQDTWYQSFCEICFADTEGAGQIAEALSRITIISFNYDRCIEQLVRSAIESLYSLPRIEAARLAEKLKVLHPYGTLGQLPIEPRDKGVSFGADFSTIDFKQMFDGIQTFNETSKTQSEIKNAVANAERAVVLGFGYHKPNLDIIASPAANLAFRRVVFGTARGFAQTAVESIRHSLQECFSVAGPAGNMPATVYLKDANCTQLLDEYRVELIEN